MKVVGGVGRTRNYPVIDQPVPTQATNKGFCADAHRLTVKAIVRLKLLEPRGKTNFR